MIFGGQMEYKIVLSEEKSVKMMLIREEKVMLGIRECVYLRVASWVLFKLAWVIVHVFV